MKYSWSMKAAYLLLTALIFGFAPIVAAGNDNPNHFAWRGEPLPTQYFQIIEFGYSYRLAQSSAPRYGENRQFHLQWELGGMRNTSPKWAFGMTCYCSADDDGSRVAVKLRGRHWLGRRTSIDFGMGPVVRTFSSLVDHSPGLVAGIAYNKGDLIALSVTLELIPWKEPMTAGGYTGPPVFRKGTETSVYTGVKFGSYAGLVVGVAVPLVIFIDYLSRAASD